MFYGSVRAEPQSTSTIKTKSCAHRQHTLYAVHSSLVFMGDSTGWMRDTVLNLKLRFRALLLLFLFWLVLWPSTNLPRYLCSITSKSFWCFKNLFSWNPHHNEYFKTWRFFIKNHYYLLIQNLLRIPYVTDHCYEKKDFFREAELFAQLLIICWCVICHLQQLFPPLAWIINTACWPRQTLFQTSLEA